MSLLNPKSPPQVNILLETLSFFNNLCLQASRSNIDKIHSMRSSSDLKVDGANIAARGIDKSIFQHLIKQLYLMMIYINIAEWANLRARYMHPLTHVMRSTHLSNENTCPVGTE
jgi:hypothetical protein